MDNRPDQRLMYDEDDEKIYYRNSESSYQQIQEIIEEQRNTLEIQPTTFPGKSKNVPKTFCCALKKYIQDSFSQDDIRTNPDLNKFHNFDPQKYTKRVLQNFLKTSQGRQVGNFFFGSCQFCQYILTNNRSRLSFSELFKEIPKYYQIKKCHNNQDTNNINQFFQDFNDSQQFNSWENKSTISYMIGRQIDDERRQISENE